MTIASEITRINNNIASAYTALSNKGATMPVTQDSANLATTVESIPSISENIYYVNYDKYGTLQINTHTGIVSGFVNNSYILTNKKLDYRPSSFEYQVCFITGNDVSTIQFLISDYAYNGNVFGIDSGKFIWYVSSNTSSWDILNGITGTTNLSPNTKYWVRIVFDGNSYKCYLSTTGNFSGEETTEINVSSSTSIHASTYTYFGIQNLNGSLYCPFLGSIDLSMTHIKSNGEFLWSAGIIIN